MPYIKQEDRRKFNDILNQLKNEIDINSPGELNYLITSIVHTYIKQFPNLNYITINEVIGALECAKMELYRKVAVPYEEKKITENGDV